ncbi:MAG TPA: hypothetical protein PLQ83_18700, partial [Thermoflexales bacterium]|nr:hypothetical protein [Thermoflexales bacterium]
RASGLFQAGVWQGKPARSSGDPGDVDCWFVRFGQVNKVWSGGYDLAYLAHLIKPYPLDQT